ncbi:hypothetical protein LMG33818_001827 [Halomonadaceae bacterium LMG 33818]|uniref:DUF72 domain-containing protein n=1 Tax=Cernens ardua TaxID=3402176 RepID=UPI003EDB7BC5
MSRGNGRLYLGLPMWANGDWRGSLYAQHMDMQQSLKEYATVFSAVEGNTTFYSGAPKSETIQSWLSSAPETFKFSFKLPSLLTHEKRLHEIDSELNEFLDRISPLGKRLGPVMIQLPRNFGPDEVEKLEAVLAHWPRHIPCAVEPRDIALFNKDAVEKYFNRLLITYQVDRVLLDVRPLFSTPSNNDLALVHAQKEKPKRPLHVISTGVSPIIRFIGHTDMNINDYYFTPWIERIVLWITQGKTPFLFVHTADNKSAPALARQCLQRIEKRLLDNSSELPEGCYIGEFPGERQGTLF